MSDYRRTYIPGGNYFFTVVTHQRKPLFSLSENVDLLRNAFRVARRERYFDLEAIVVLPDHLHCLWNMPLEDADFSGRWRIIKKWVSKRVDAPINRRGEKKVWQRRFWEHLIRDEEDWRRHMDYIHFNPVKHGHVRSPGDWPYSSFARMVKCGWYAPDWGAQEPDALRGVEWE